MTKLTDEQVDVLLAAMDNWTIKWTWYGHDVRGAYVYYITKDVGVDGVYMFAGLQSGSSENSRQSPRLWTRDKRQAVVFDSDRSANAFIEKTFVDKEKQKLLIVREG